MSLTILFLAANALSVERIAYAAIWRRPDRFRAICAKRAGGAAPEIVLRRMFYGFKAIQAIVFAGWIAYHGWGVSGDPRAIAVGTTLIAVGQALNATVFYRLGSVGVFYGSRFGRDVPWVSGFPFSALSHPQYVGTVASIWGLFLVTRFPDADWIALPLLETMLYAVGARFERDRGDARCSQADPVVDLRSPQALAAGESDVAPALSRRLPLGHRDRVLSDRGRPGGRTARASRSGTVSRTRPARSAAAHTGDVACDSYHRFAEDVALLRAMNLTSYRFSIAWPRIQPERQRRARTRRGSTTTARLVDALLDAGIRPFPTLYHWDLPQALEERGRVARARHRGALRGLRRDRRARARRPRLELDDLQRADGLHDHGLLRGDPRARAPRRRRLPARLATVNLAQGEAFRAMRAVKSDAVIGTAFSMSACEPARDTEQDRDAADRWHRFANCWYLEPALRGRYPDAFVDSPFERMGIRDDDLSLVRAPLDFIGINLYTRTPIEHRDSDPLGMRANALVGPVGGKQGPKTDFGWEVWPDALHDLVMRITREYDRPPIEITENGCSYRRRPRRARRDPRYPAHRLLPGLPRGSRARDRRRRGRARLPRVVAARQLRVVGGLRAALRSGLGRLSHRSAHDQGVRALVRPRSRGERLRGLASAANAIAPAHSCTSTAGSGRATRSVGGQSVGSLVEPSKYFA